MDTESGEASYDILVSDAFQDRLHVYQFPLRQAEKPFVAMESSKGTTVVRHRYGKGCGRSHATVWLSSLV